MEYVYTVWFRDLTVPIDDPDYEWPACFIIEGKSEQSCKKWGDYLANKYSKGNKNCFLNSEIERKDKSELTGIDDLPIINEYEEATDEKIGW